MSHEGPLGNPAALEQQAFLSIFDLGIASGSENILSIDVEDQFRFNSNLNKFYIVIDGQGQDNLIV